MTEEQLNALRQADSNLRDALKMDVAERPQMPADLNERLMQRVAVEKKKPRRIIWPWIAAACVAGVLMIWLTPPKDEAKDVVAENKPAVIEQPVIINKVERPLVAQVETEAEKPIKVLKKTKKVSVQEETSSQDTQITPTPQAVDDFHEMAVFETVETQEKPVTLSEHDVPITRPENLKYTPEEMALMKKQANEAYLKWVELELEIAKYHLEQTAQK